MSYRQFCDDMYRRGLALKDAQPVPGDFLIKRTGMELFVELSGLRMGGKVLEIGCGSGFNAALLSGACSHLVATDLPSYDAHTHSLGIGVAKKLLDSLGVGNVSVLSCSGEVLPFPDNTFDCVFSSSVVEHISDKESAVKEMLRVVKPGGAVVFVIPTYVQSVCAFPHLYLYAIKRLWEVACVKTLRSRGGRREGMLPSGDDIGRSGASIAGSFKKNHPSFPLPEPHGSYKDIFQEFRCQLPWSWRSFARRCGASSVDTFSLLFLPFNILEVFSTRAIAQLYYLARHMHRLLGRSLAQYFCYAWCVVAKK